MMSLPDLDTIDRIVDHLGRTRSILFVTGAGMSADSGLPTYRGVGGLLLFGKMLPEAASRELKYQLGEGFDVVFSIGTTSVFPYISYPVEVARQRDKPSVEINLSTTHVSGMVRYRLALGAAVALDAIWTRYNEQHVSR